MMLFVACTSIYICCCDLFEGSMTFILVKSLQFHSILFHSIKFYSFQRSCCWHHRAATGLLCVILQPTSVATINHTLIVPLQCNWQLESPVSVESLYRSTWDQARGFRASVLWQQSPDQARFIRRFNKLWNCRGEKNLPVPPVCLWPIQEHKLILSQYLGICLLRLSTFPFFSNGI